MHTAVLVRLEPGRSAEEFLEAYRARAETGGERPAWAQYVGGPGVTPSQGESNVTLNLEPGSYVMFCDLPFPGHVLKPHALEVRPPSGEALASSAPAPTVSVRLFDYRFQLSAPLTAGRHTIHVENIGVEPHQVILVVLAPGKTVDDLKVWLGGR